MHDHYFRGLCKRSLSLPPPSPGMSHCFDWYENLICPKLSFPNTQKRGKPQPKIKHSQSGKPPPPGGKAVTTRHLLCKIIINRRKTHQTGISDPISRRGKQRGVLNKIVGFCLASSGMMSNTHSLYPHPKQYSENLGAWVRDGELDPKEGEKLASEGVGLS